jgi:hypothetical protein
LTGNEVAVNTAVGTVLENWEKVVAEGVEADASELAGAGEEVVA